MKKLYESGLATHIGPQVMRSRSRGGRRSVDRGTYGPGIEPRKKIPPGRRHCRTKRKAPSGAPISRGVPESRVVRDLVHVRKTSRGNWEIPGLPKAAVAVGRIGGSKDVRR
jgi:hypothetical protein